MQTGRRDPRLPGLRNEKTTSFVTDLPSPRGGCVGGAAFLLLLARTGEEARDQYELSQDLRSRLMKGSEKPDLNAARWDWTIARRKARSEPLSRRTCSLGDLSALLVDSPAPTRAALRNWYALIFRTDSEKPAEDSENLASRFLRGLRLLQGAAVRRVCPLSGSEGTPVAEVSCAAFAFKFQL